MFTWIGSSEVYSTTDLFSLGLGEDFTVHDGCCGDAPCHRVDLKQAAHAWWLNGVGHLTILALIHILSHHLEKFGVEGRKGETGKNLSLLQ